MNDPRQDLAEILRSCVECGLCLPHCATYLATGSEVQSPRGRLALLGEVLDQDDSAPPDAFLSAFDQCIGCRACVTACPSGVPYDLLAHGHDLADSGAFQAPVATVPGPVLRRLDRPGTLRLLGAAAAGLRTVARSVWGNAWRSRLERGPLRDLARLAGSVPRAPGSDAELDTLCRSLVHASGAEPAPAPEPAAAASRGRLHLFRGCANEGLLPGTSRRLHQVLRRAGYDVQVPPGQDCCGALAAHTARPGRAATLARRNAEAFGAAGPPVVVEAAGCGLELGQGGLGDRVHSAAQVLAAAPLALRSVPLKLVLHDPCHARHGGGDIAASRRLLDAIPDLAWCEPEEPDVCCGSGGAWGLRYPEMSEQLGRRKAADLAATGADLVVTTNPGCLGQIADGLALEAPDLPILPLTDLWWYAAGSPGHDV